MSKELKYIQETRHNKAGTIITSKIKPQAREGSNGDLRLTDTENGMKLYAKHNNQWFAFSPDSELVKGKVTTKSIATNGYETFASGLIMQWGRAGDIATSDALETTTAVTFPTAFPTSCFTVVATYWLEGTDTGGVGESAVQGHIGVNETNFDRSGCVFTTDTDIEAFFWIAIGN